MKEKKMLNKEIRTVSDFMAKCFNNPLLKKHDMTVFYRGVNKVYPVETRHIPSLYYPPNEFYEHEDKIFKEFVSVFPDEMLAHKLTIEKLFIMRHYGYPTRLLDISKNPLVDLFFACFADKGQDSTKNEDGVVYIYAVPNEKIKFSDGDTVAMLANICKRPSRGLHCLDKNDEDALGYLAYETKQERLDFSEKYLKWDALNTVVCLRPRMNNPRIIRQSGYFFLFGINGKKEKYAKMPPEWIKDEIIIPAQYKQSILEELNTMDYNEGFFYPDFEHVSNVLRRRYGKIGKC
jgi:hypothetical protein